MREEEQRLREENAREVEIARQQAAELEQLRETTHDEHEDAGDSGGEPRHSCYACMSLIASDVTELHLDRPSL